MAAYAFNFDGHGVFTPDGKTNLTPAQAEAHNAKLVEGELSLWATKPDTFAAYVVGKEIQLWSGQKIGDIARLVTFRTNISRNMVAITMRGTNGATYHGRYGADWSQLIRLRKST